MKDQIQNNLVKFETKEQKEDRKKREAAVARAIERAKSKKW